MNEEKERKEAKTNIASHKRVIKKNTSEIGNRNSKRHKMMKSFLGGIQRSEVDQCFGLKRREIRYPSSNHRNAYILCFIIQQSN